MEGIKAVVFDFDGVLGRTMEDNYRAWGRAFAPLGVELDREEYFLMEGMSSRAVAAAILARHGLDPAKGPEIALAKDENYRSDNRFALYPGVPEVLDRLGASLPLGLVSGASSGRLKATLPPGFLGRFAVTVTADSVGNCKPHPEPYLAAARALGLPPPTCLAVENAPLGIASAKGAGMRCVGVTSTLGRDLLAAADAVVDDIRLLPGLLGLTGAGG